MEGEKGFRESGVVVGGCGPVVGVGDVAAVGGEDHFAPSAVGGMTFPVAFDVEVVAACRSDDDFGDASGGGVGVDPGSDEVDGCGGGWKCGDRGGEGGENGSLF